MMVKFFLKFKKSFMDWKLSFLRILKNFIVIMFTAASYSIVGISVYCTRNFSHHCGYFKSILNIIDFLLKYEANKTK